MYISSVNLNDCEPRKGRMYALILDGGKRVPVQELGNNRLPSPGVGLKSVPL